LLATAVAPQRAEEARTVVKGTIVISADAGRALRKHGAALLTTHILGCAGDFHIGDKVYVVVRGDDGGQSVIATGIVRCDERVLTYAKSRSAGVSNVPIDGGAPAVVIAEQDLCLLWSRGR
jgi:glutamate 5-kinase